MKITDYAIACLLLLVASFYAIHFRVDDAFKVQELQNRYTTALRAAVKDASMVLHRNEKQQFEPSYESRKRVRVDQQSALDTFKKTMALNIGITEDDSSMRLLFHYIPAIIVIDYDGYHIYSTVSYTTDKGQNVVKPVWQPKKPYIYVDENGSSVNFTLDHYVYVYDAVKQMWHEGFQPELTHKTTVCLLNDTSLFNQVRLRTIVTQIENDLAHAINKHNQMYTRNGVGYTFTLPTIEKEQWYNSVQDVGIIAFVQGIPIGNQYYNNYALATGRVLQSHRYVGGIDETTGIKYVYPAWFRCSYRLEEVFTNKKEAVAKGYFELNVNHVK